MGYAIDIQGDLSKQDLRILESYLRKLLEEATGEPVEGVTYDGVVKTDLDQLKDQLAR